MGSRRRDGDLLGGATASPIRDASSLLGVPDHPQQRRSFVEGRQHFLLLVEGEPKRRRPEFLLDLLPNFVILSLSLDLIHPILYHLFDGLRGQEPPNRQHLPAEVDHLAPRGLAHRPSIVVRPTNSQQGLRRRRPGMPLLRTLSVDGPAQAQAEQATGPG